jgi:cell division protein FtsI (penicillin-binding protein 3)
MGVVGGALAIGLISVLGWVYYLQTVRGDALEKKVEHRNHDELEMNVTRGSILDRDGTEMAVTVEVPSLYVRPDDVERPRRAARQLSPHLDMAFSEIVEALTSDRSFVWLERQTKPASAQAIEDLEIEGVKTTEEHDRYYPLGSTAGQVIGFTGIDDRGLEGVERMMDEALRGDTYELSGMRDVDGQTLLTRQLPDFEQMAGNDVVLTLDDRIQRVAQRAVRKQVRKYDAKAGYGVVLDVETGDVLAMTNTPDFDPNRFRSYRSEDWRLRPMTDAFEPGSIFKPFVLAAALEEETINLRTAFDCEEGRLQIGRHVIHDSHPHDILTSAEIIQKSSNIGIYKIAQTIGPKTTYRYIRDFGFGRETGIDFNGERAGSIASPDRWADVRFANISFGQGLSATPVQIARALHVLARDGLLMEPHLIDEVRDPKGRTLHETKPTLVRRVISKSTANQTTRAMSLVPLEEGTGGRAALDHFTVAGKTGTAQKIDPETGGYAENKWLGSFVGFVPAEKPEFVIVVMIDEPKGEHYGGIVAAPAFREIAKKSLAIRGVVPLSSEDRFEFAVDSRDDESADSDDVSVPSKDFVSASERVDVGPDRVPDVRGMTLRRAVTTASEHGLSPRIEGWGRVVSQTPAPGTPLSEVDRLRLVLDPVRTSSDSPTPSTGPSP